MKYLRIGWTAPGQGKFWVGGRIFDCWCLGLSSSGETHQDDVTGREPLPSGEDGSDEDVCGYTLPQKAGKAISIGRT